MMASLETDLLIKYEYLLANHKWNNIYDLAVGICVDLYTLIPEIIENKDQYPSLFPLVDTIKSSIDFNVVIDDLINFENILSLYFKRVISSKLSLDELRFYAGYFIVISHVNDDGSFQLDKDWEEIFSSSWGVPLINQANISIETLRTDESILTDNLSDSLSPLTTTDENSFSVKTKKSGLGVKLLTRKEVTYTPVTLQEKELERFWNSLVETNEFDFNYIWRNKISNQQYEELKRKIKDCSIGQRKLFPEHFPHILVIYIAEWYKREYNGNDLENPLKALGIDKSPKAIWENCKLHEDLLYTKTNNLYLESLYVLGGLPIAYLISKQFSKAFKEISQQISQDGLTISSNQDLKDFVFCNNYVVKKSLASDNGSLRLYFDELINGRYPFAEEDCDKEPFRTFIKNLTEWKAIRKKFSYEWIVEGNLESDKLRRKFRVNLNPELNGSRHRSMSYERLARWKIASDIQSFRLYLCFNDDEYPRCNIENEDYITFYNTYDGYFVAKLSSNHYIFSSIPDYPIYRARLVAAWNSSYVEIDSIDVEPYLQLYETGIYSVLSTKKRTGKTYALLPSSTPLKEIEYTNFTLKYFGNDKNGYKLLEICDSLTICDNTFKCPILYKQEGCIKVLITKYDDTIKYTDSEKLFHYYYDDKGKFQSELVPLIFNKSDFHVVKFERDYEKIEIPLDELTFAFKQNEDTEYRCWTDEDYPKQGIVVVRIEGIHFKTDLRVYIIPCRQIAFRRNLSTRELQINAAVSVYKMPDYFNISRLSEESISYTDVLDDKCSDAVNEVFLGNERDYLKVPIFKSFNRLDVFQNDILIMTFMDNQLPSTLRLPFLLKDYFRIRYITSGGVEELSLKDIHVSYLDFKFEDNENSMYNEFEYSSSFVRIVFYLCKINSINNSFVFYIGKDNQQNYRFYHWNMKIEDQPILIESIEQENLLYLKLSKKQKKTGLIFQSLENGITPIYYYAPKVKGAWPAQGHDMKLAIKCIEIAIKHAIPFRIFSPIYEVLKGNDKRLINVALDYLSMSETLENFQYIGLYRMSKELYFSWLFLNRTYWLDPSFNKEEDGLCGDKEKKIRRDTWFPKAEHLFSVCHDELSLDNLKSFNDFVDVYWQNPNRSNSHNLKLAPAAKGKLWLGIDSEGVNFFKKGDSIEQMAIRFMRPVLVNNSSKTYSKKVIKKGKAIKEQEKTKGFTLKEQVKGNAEGGRCLKDITKFIGMLEKDPKAYIHIETFLRSHLYVKTKQ